MIRGKLIKKIYVTQELKLLSGLHIGDSKENAEIGGIDSPVVRRKDKKREPYIPGSSLKGKMRSLIEQKAGISKIGGEYDKEVPFADKDNNVQKINYFFGFAGDGLPSSIIVRDAYLTEESKKLLEESEFTDMPYTEEKSENSIDRITGTASNPRRIERVPAGTKFKLEFIINIYEKNNFEINEIEMLKHGLELINNDYLGGSGSRGYGHVSIEFENLEIEDIPFKYAIK